VELGIKQKPNSKTINRKYFIYGQAVAIGKKSIKFKTLLFSFSKEGY
jgi:hypothetical protein